MIRRPPRSPLFPYTPLSRSPSSQTAEFFLPPRFSADQPERFEGAACVAESPFAGTIFGIAVPPVRHDSADVSARRAPDHPRDRKSTRLNSSHSQISYAVFCL